MNIESVTVNEIIAAASAKQASLVAESSGHLVLAAGQAMAGLPLRVSRDNVTLSTEGTVQITGSPSSVSSVASIQSERELLHELLRVSHGPAPSLRALGEGARFSHTEDQEGWSADLASALIPINRGAAKRALARLARETIRAKRHGMLTAATPLPPVADSTPETIADQGAIGAEPMAAGPAAEGEIPLEERIPASDFSVEIPLEFSEPVACEPEPTPTATEVDVVVTEASEQPPEAAVPDAEQQVAKQEHPLEAVPEPTNAPLPEGEPTAETIEATPTGDAPEPEQEPAADRPASEPERLSPAAEPELPLQSFDELATTKASPADQPLRRASVGPPSPRAASPDEPQPFLPSPSAPVPELWEAVQQVLALDPTDSTPTPSAPVEERATFIGLGTAPAPTDPDRIVHEASTAAAAGAESTAGEGEASSRDECVPPPPSAESVDSEGQCTEAAGDRGDAPPSEPVGRTPEAPEDIVSPEDGTRQAVAAMPSSPAQPADEISVLPIAPIGAAPDRQDQQEDSGETEEPLAPPVLTFESDRRTLPPAPPLLRSGPNNGRYGPDGAALRSDTADDVDLPDELLAEFSEAIGIEHAAGKEASMQRQLEFASSTAPLSTPTPEGIAEPALPTDDDVVPIADVEVAEEEFWQDHATPWDAKLDAAVEERLAAGEMEAVELEPSCTVSDLTGATDDAVAEPPPPPASPHDETPASTCSAVDPPAPPTPSEPELELERPTIPTPARTVESLLDQFGDDGSPGGARTLREAARSLKKFALVATPTPPPATPFLEAAPEPDRSTPSPTSGLTVSTANAEPPSIPPQSFAPQPLRSPRATLRWSAALLVLGLVAVGALWLRYPAFFAGGDSPLAQSAPERPAEAVAGRTFGRCWSDLEVRDLPSPHEVLLRLGETPVGIDAVPTGTPLELVVTAPEHLSRRIVIEPDAQWEPSAAGPTLTVHADLPPGAGPAWPSAAPGAVGGTGPAGTLHVTAAPPGAEVWLVVAAGTARQTTTAIPCGRAAELLVVNPLDPQDRRRVTVPAAAD